MSPDTANSTPVCKACHGHGPHSRVDAAWRRFDSDAVCPDCGEKARPLLVSGTGHQGYPALDWVEPASTTEIIGWAHALAAPAETEQDERTAAVDETLATLRRVLLLLDEDDLAGQLGRLRGRAALLDPRKRAPENLEVLTRACPQCWCNSRPHRYQPRMWVCEGCTAVWSVQGREVVVEQSVV